MPISIPERYVFVEDLAPGGMSSVALYQDINLDRNVAIKVISPGKHYRRAFDEIAALERLRSDYVLDVFDVLVDNDTREIGIVQEYLDGRDLADHIKKHKTSAGENLRIIFQISTGVADIHSAGVVHRDIKPQNLRLLPDERIVIFDFGLARMIENGGQTTGFVGSIPYAAPELFKDGLVMFDESVDVYAIGAVAFRLATGSTLPAVDKRFATPQVIAADAVGNSAEVAALLTRALDIDPARRPTAAELRNACERELLRDRHRALLVHEGTTYTISAENRNISLRVGNTSVLQITYNGLDFIVTNVEGRVLRNNSTVAAGDVLEGSLVFTFGGEAGPYRVYVPFDISHPEVIA